MDQILVIDRVEIAAVGRRVREDSALVAGRPGGGAGGGI
jgi:hypothetical protein